eukprot:scaffold301_cov243-Pinguiococcus_pyrenoidosus.AAC.87
MFASRFVGVIGYGSAGARKLRTSRPMVPLKMGKANRMSTGTLVPRDLRIAFGDKAAANRRGRVPRNLNGRCLGGIFRSSVHVQALQADRVPFGSQICEVARFMPRDPDFEICSPAQRANPVTSVDRTARSAKPLALIRFRAGGKTGPGWGYLAS